MYPFYPQIAPLMPQKSLFIQIPCCQKAFATYQICNIIFHKQVWPPPVYKIYKKNRCFGSGEPPLVQNANVAERVLKRFDYPKLPKLQCFDVALRGAKKLEEPKSLTYGATRLPRAPIKCIAPIYDVAKLRCCEVANLELLPLSFTSRL